MRHAVRFSVLSTAFILSTVFTGPAADAAIPAFAVNRNAFRIQDAAAHLVPIKTTGQTSLNFNASGPSQKTLITYTAECQVFGFTGSWLHVEVLVDGVAVSPSDDDQALCSGGGAGVGGRWSSNTISVVATGLAAGAHTLSLRATFVAFNVGNEAWLDDTTLVLIR